jgi:hypothetical protein
VDSGPQPQPQKGVQVGGQTLAGTQPSFLIWYTNEWTGLRPYLGISGGLPLSSGRSWNGTVLGSSSCLDARMSTRHHARTFKQSIEAAKVRCSKVSAAS